MANVGQEDERSYQKTLKGNLAADQGVTGSCPLGTLVLDFGPVFSMSGHGITPMVYGDSQGMEGRLSGFRAAITRVLYSSLSRSCAGSSGF